MPAIVKSDVPRIVYFKGWEDEKHEGPSFMFMPGEERTVSDEQLKELRAIPRFAHLEKKRAFIVYPVDAKAKVGERKLPEAADPNVAAKLFAAKS